MRHLLLFISLFSCLQLSAVPHAQAAAKGIAVKETEEVPAVNWGLVGKGFSETFKARREEVEARRRDGGWAAEEREAQLRGQGLCLPLPRGRGARDGEAGRVHSARPLRASPGATGRRRDHPGGARWPGPDGGPGEG